MSQPASAESRGTFGAMKVHARIKDRSIAMAMAALLFLAWGAPRQAEALSCIGPDASRSVESSDVVIVGAPVRIDGMYGEVKVEKYLKGSGPESVRIESEMAGWGGFWDQESIGHRWVFFLDHAPGSELAEFVAHACTGSTSVDTERGGTFFDEALAATGNGPMPEVTTKQVSIMAAPENTGGQRDGAVGFWVAGVIGLGALASLLVMKRKGWMGV